MRFITQMLLLLGLLAIAGCEDTRSTAQGEAVDRGAAGHVQVGVPF